MGAEIDVMTSAEEIDAARTFLRACEIRDTRTADALEGAQRDGGLVLAARHQANVIGLLVSGQPAGAPAGRREVQTGGICVAREFRGRGIGTALKLRERSWAMERGVHRIVWPFDAADSQQAYFSIRRLAAFVREITPRQGPGEATAEWWLGSPRVRTRLEGRRQPPVLADYLEAETPKLNPAALDDRDLPVPCESPGRPDRNLALVELPPDICRLEAMDPPLAAAWRDHLRDVLQDAFQRGYLATDFLYLKEERLPRSYYLLSHGEALLGL